MNPIFIVKANKEREEFDPAKLMQSLLRSGASLSTSREVLAAVEKTLKDGMSTASIYRHAFSLLHKKERIAALRYSLRKALMDLGPSGFPFESFLAEIFRAKGFKVVTDQIVQGRCVQHEVDLVALNEKQHLMIEVKFHNERGIKTDLKVALYVAARFEDILKVDPEHGKKEEGWLITNTKFTQSAIDYGMCKGLTLVGWSHPAKGNLRDIIEESGLHPLTCLSLLNGAQKKTFLDKGVVLCRDVLKHSDTLESVGISGEKRKQLEGEINQLCSLV